MIARSGSGQQLLQADVAAPLSARETRLAHRLIGAVTGSLQVRGERDHAQYPSTTAQQLPTAQFGACLEHEQPVITRGKLQRHTPLRRTWVSWGGHHDTCRS